MKYEDYQYIEPPKAENAVMAGSLFFYEKRGWIAQVKKNGTSSVVFVPPKWESAKPMARTRHGDEEHKAWAFTDKSIRIFEELRDERWSVFCCELMHSKGHGLRDTNYIHDVLVWDGEYLLGKTLEFRQDLLSQIFMTDKLRGPQSHYVVDSNTWVARNHRMGFKKLFERLTNEDEGLVLKNPHGVLTTKGNSNWLVKCRKLSENYGF
jgi:hypothetical protein